jgi:hypothetical protein
VSAGALRDSGLSYYRHVTLLELLRDLAPEGALGRLADLIVADSLGRPLGEVVDLERWPRLVAEVVGAWAASDAAEARLVQAVLDGVDALEGVEGPLGERIPVPVRRGLHDLAARPYSPRRELVLRLLDQPPARKLMREVLMDAVTGFASKARSAGESSSVGGLASGLGRFAKRRAGALGTLAGDVIGAVGSEVERAVEQRASEFVDGALGEAMGRLADQIADPARAADQAALRTALLDGALTLTGPELAAELRGADPAALGSLVRSSLAGWVTADGFEDQVRDWLTGLVAAEGDRTLGETLDELALRDTVTRASRELLLSQAHRLVSTPAFSHWLQGLEDS